MADYITQEFYQIIKGQNGTPGELQGIIDYKNSTPIGTIDKNSSYGIYGTIDNSIVKKHSLSLMSVGYRYSVHKGKAYVIFTGIINMMTTKLKLHNLTITIPKISVLLLPLKNFLI